MVTNEDLQGMLIICLTGNNIHGQDATAQLRNRISEIVESASISKLLIDLGGVEFLSSEIMGQLILVKKRCDQKEIAFALCNISPVNMKALKLVRCDLIMQLFEDKDAAIEALVKAAAPVPGKLLSDEEVADLSKRAENGDVDAMFELGQRQSSGDGIDQDVVGAVKWFEKAAELNHPDAQYNLASCYAFGQGVEQDYANAMPWYHKAAELGHADAQYMFAMSCQYALNDTCDLDLAKNWYHKAADQGHEKAGLALAELSAP